MRGQSYPSGFVIYEREKAIIGVEDLSFLVKFVVTVIAISFLIEITQQIALPVILTFVFLAKIAYETSEWHAIEHKLIYLLENKLPLTIDNIEKAPMKQGKRCGFGDRLLRKPSARKMSMALEAAQGIKVE